jgi:AcrR family transcriptional regulator
VTRQYDSSRRKKAAEQTRRDIVRAALKLHRDGVTEFEPLAHEAGCSPATVRKHYPTKEALFKDCTRAFGESVEMPDVEAIAGLEGPRERTDVAIRELLRIHEAMFGYAWHSAYLRRDSPTLDSVMDDYEKLADAISDVIAPPGSSKAPIIRGLLDHLSYRALRLSGGLSAEDTAEALCDTVSRVLDL